MPIICCGAQITSAWNDPRATLEKAGGYVRRASEQGARLIAFPEQFATGWDPQSHRYIEELSGQVTQRLREFAMQHRITVVGSFRELHSPLPRNTAVAIGPSGEILATYAKCHLFSPAREERFYDRGESLATFDLDGVRFGIAICYDLRFSTVFEAYADTGADAVVVMAAWPSKRSTHWDLFLRARAAEYQLYLIGVNTTGITPVDAYAGGSSIVDPAGNVLAAIGPEEGMICSLVDPEMVRAVRKAMPLAKDRKTEFIRNPHRSPPG